MSRKEALIVSYGGLSCQEHNIEFLLSERYFAQFEGSEIKNGECKVDILLKKHSSFLEMEVSIKGEVIVECDRCLEELALPIDVISKLIVKFSLEITEPEFEINVEDEDIIWINQSDGNIDLTQYIFDSVSLSLPISRIHLDAVSGCNEEMLERFTPSN